MNVRTGLMVALSIVVVGCNAALHQADGPVAIHTQAQAPNPGDACPAASVTGQLVADPTWGLALRGTSGTRGVVWGYGYSARRDAGKVVLLDPSGNTIAKEGDSVRLGGNVGADGAAHPCDPLVIEITKAS
jgi:hypothetical protein